MAALQAPAAATTTATPRASTPEQDDSGYHSTLSARRQHYGPNAALSYQAPLMAVRGQGTYLYDQHGVQYLDCVNNVAHLGHANAEVAAAVSAQLHTLNTNSRYLHPDLAAYTAELLETLNDDEPARADGAAAAAACRPAACQSGACRGRDSDSTGTSDNGLEGGRAGWSRAGGGPPHPQPSTPHPRDAESSQRSAAAAAASAPPAPAPACSPYDSAATAVADRRLEVAYLVCSGSEANDLALRIIAANRPGATHVAVMAGAYHGHTTALIQLSPYKFWGPGGGGKPAHVHVVPCPDPYRGENLDGRAAARAVLAAARRAGGRLGGFFCESILSCGGQVVLPPGYLQGMYEELHAEGVVTVADEVQCGFGRVGDAFWGFQTQRVRPDIVTMGKPIGNGYPLAALATTRALAAGFAAPGMEYFNTYGGSTAAVAAGRAVLRVLRRERLQEHAARVGSYLQDGLRALSAGPGGGVLGHVRGLGLFLGAEVVEEGPADGGPRRHAPVMARWIKERMKARHVLLSTDGPYDNVLKVKPPLVFGLREADMLLGQLREVLRVDLTPAVRSRLAAEEAAHRAAVLEPRLRAHADNERQLYGATARL